MNSPFEFGKIVKGKSFTNRREELKRLLSNFDNKVNTILISPRRWGKSSLVYKSASLSERKKNIFCFIDLFHIRNENDFYSTFAKTILKSGYGKVQELKDFANNFLRNLKPKLVFPVDNTNNFEIELSFGTKDNTYEDILDLPEKIALKKNINFIICIDEFQNLQFFENPVLFQKRLRSVWQHHSKSIYCLYGSRKHMMSSLFQDQSMPFYKFGDIINLSKISSEHFVPFIIDGFKRTGKNIDEVLAQKITEFAECHPHYVQQLAHLVWINTVKSTTVKELKSASDDLIDQNSGTYMVIAESLNNRQINLLKALAEGNREFLSSQNIISKYNLGTSANVVKIRRVLEEKEIIESNKDGVDFIDPIFKMWFKKYYM